MCGFYARLYGFYPVKISFFLLSPFHRIFLSLSRSLSLTHSLFLFFFPNTLSISLLLFLCVCLFVFVNHNRQLLPNYRVSNIVGVGSEREKEICRDGVAVLRLLHWLNWWNLFPSLLPPFHHSSILVYSLCWSLLAEKCTMPSNMMAQNANITTRVTNGTKQLQIEYATVTISFLQEMNNSHAAVGLERWPSLVACIRREKCAGSDQSWSSRYHRLVVSGDDSKLNSSAKCECFNAGIGTTPGRAFKTTLEEKHVGQRAGVQEASGWWQVRA